MKNRIIQNKITSRYLKSVGEQFKWTDRKSSAKKMNGLTAEVFASYLNRMMPLDFSKVSSYKIIIIDRD